jgi:hypothetical protein
MTQLIDNLPAESRQILCCYCNGTTQIQIVRITNIPHWYFERVVFPQQRLLFSAVPEAKLQIYTTEAVSATIGDNILCDRLQVEEKELVHH